MCECVAFEICIKKPSCYGITIIILLTAVQLKDMQGHLYSLTNATVKFSEPQDDPIPDSKLRMELGNVVRNTLSLRNGKVPSTVEFGSIKTLGW